MKYQLIITESYKKREKEFLRMHREMVSIYAKTLVLLLNDPYHPSLRLHKLKGRLSQFYSISVNMKYRIVIEFIIKDGKIIPIDVGDHDIYERK